MTEEMTYEIKQLFFEYDGLFRDHKNKIIRRPIPFKNYKDMCL